MLSMVKADYDEERAQDFMFASALAYCPAEDVFTLNCGAATTSTIKRGFKSLFSLDNNDLDNPIHMTISRRSEKKELVVAFSGTKHSSQLVNQLKKALPVFYTTHHIPGALVFEYFFYHYTKTFRDALLGHLKIYLEDPQYSDYSIIYTGHSLGGALAMHAIADSIHSGLLTDHKTELWTYGQPRIANKDFLDSFIPQIDEYYRIVNNRDLVAHLPPCISFLRNRCGHDGLLPFYPYHAPTEVFYEKDMSEYVVCSDTDGEDESCSNKFDNISVEDHKIYWGVSIGSYHTQISEEDLGFKEDDMTVVNQTSF